MKIFKNRTAAGQLLAKRLKNVHADLVLGIPRGGVVVAYEVAKKLKLPLDVIVARKIGAPNQSELALGAIDPDGDAIWEEELLKELGTRREDLGEEVKIQWKELKRREDLYRDGKPQPELDGKTIILIDDGMATGATMQAAVSYLKRHEANVILAVPVASFDALDKVRNEVDDAMILEIPEPFGAVGAFYHEFEPVDDETVVKLLS